MEGAAKRQFVIPRALKFYLTLERQTIWKCGICVDIAGPEHNPASRVLLHVSAEVWPSSPFPKIGAILGWEKGQAAITTIACAILSSSPSASILASRIVALITTSISITGFRGAWAKHSDQAFIGISV